MKKLNQKQKFVLIIVVLLILFLAVLFGIKAFYPKQTYPTYTYNGFGFVKMAGMWYTKVQIDNRVVSVPLHFGPKEVENITITGDIEPFTKIKANVLTFDPESDNLQYMALAMAELSLNLAQGLNITPVASCTDNLTEACKDLEIYNCETDKDHAIIYLKQGNETKVERIDNCIIVQGKEMDLIKSVDRLLYSFYKIIR